MGYNEAGFIRLPPDSTGKKSAAAPRLIIKAESYDPSINRFEKGQVIVGAISGASVEIVGIHTEGLNPGEIELYCNLGSLNGTFQVNEEIRVSGVTFAVISASATLDQIFYQKSVLVDRDYLDRTMKIGEYGEVYTRFDEGAPALSSFGGLITENPETIRQYVYAYSSMDVEFYDVEAGNGSLSYLPSERAILLDTGGTASGDKVTRQSHLYHPYQPGAMSKIMQTVQCGDTGKANVRRRWGYFDEQNGLFWELDGTTIYVVVRSSTTGSTINTRVAQIDWNRDQLDGSQFYNLDVSKTQLYWIDFQWLGVGVCRFGVYEDNGTKRTCHVIENPGNQTTAYMRQGTLPIRYEIENLNSASSSSELKAICAVVHSIGSIKRQYNSFGVSCDSPKTINDLNVEIPVMGIRSKSTVNGLANHAITAPTELHIISDDYSSGIFNIKIRNNAITSGGTYMSVSDNSHTEVNHNLTGFISQASSGVSEYSAQVKGGQSYSHVFESFTPHSQTTFWTTPLSDGSTLPELVITIEPVSPGASGNFYTSLNFDEMVY